MSGRGTGIRSPVFDPSETRNREHPLPPHKKGVWLLGGRFTDAEGWGYSLDLSWWTRPGSSREPIEDTEYDGESRQTVGGC